MVCLLQLLIGLSATTKCKLLQQIFVRPTAELLIWLHINLSETGRCDLCRCYINLSLLPHSHVLLVYMAAWDQ